MLACFDKLLSRNYEAEYSAYHMVNLNLQEYYILFLCLVILIFDKLLNFTRH